MKNNKLFANYEISSIAKEKGFYDICFALVDENNRINLLNISDSENLEFKQIIAKYNGVKCVPSPLLAQLIDWIREKHKLELMVLSNTHVSEEGNRWEYSIYSLHSKDRLKNELNFNLYYEALNKAIKEALKLI